ncbi:FMN-dependent NADH-azoreductase [Lacticaseibacillus kribbianus]|uniref:FMN-dependent NADH-azoreductase n=1 Tax=Lacticaseibacillus kribbianus TaxID=2926292 RepID=UPI001CD6AA15|nr:NAD(P)H-dependent oxidoreductase [Lacticaseibacillus kribbianus]
MTILLINAHPDYQNPARATNQLEAHALSVLHRLRPGATVERLNLYDPALAMPELTGAVMADPASVAAQQDALIAQWRRAELILILSPLHNFNVTAKFKTYVDNILIANKTFKYTDDGSVGLLDGTQTVAYIQTSGSDYSKDLRYVNADLAPLYVRTILNFMGLSKMTLIRAQGLDLIENDKQAIIEATKRDITAYLSGLASR